jgi:iron complex transport system ATP-binding protein
MEVSNLAASTDLVIKDNVLAVWSDKGLMALSSAIFNGGFKNVKAILNVGVPEGYNDRSLHLDPIGLITSSAEKLGLTKDYVAMLTAAKIKNYSLVSKKAGNFSVSVAATAGCSHGESSGEEMDVQEITGTINIIVLIDGNPTESCMVASLITATEAKSAALRDFDVRSLYTGDSATGSITDSVAIASTNQGKTIGYGGPASKLGKLVGYCARKAVTQALIKQEPIWANRTVLDRLKERHLPLEKLAIELSKVEGMAVAENDLAKILEKEPLQLAYLLAAVKLDEDIKNNLLSTQLRDISQLSKCFGNIPHYKQYCSEVPNYESVDLPPFLKYVLIKIVRDSLSKG